MSEGWRRTDLAGSTASELLLTPAALAALPVSAADVTAAARRIAGVVVRTPLIASAELTDRTGLDVALKLEGVQPTGSFKVRGAASKILSLDPETAARGVVTASTGNHGRAVAHVARTLGLPAAVCISEHVPAGKITALKALGCELIVGGDSQNAALHQAAELVAQRGMTLVHPFDDAQVIAGQGTIGRELLAQSPDLATALVPLSGGGLAAGVALVLKAARPDIRVIGVSMEGGAVMAGSLGHGTPIDMDEVTSLADSLQGGIGADNRFTLQMCAALLDGVVLVSEPQIWQAMRLAFEHHRLLLEGGGAVGIAALLAGRVTSDGPVAVVCSGANAEAGQIAALAQGRPSPP
ncbi:MAG TPA: pyridoxal-phosphate dependent enzyme [Euzebya sp.]|nr:pyridoxal-phosphate dependent enzyme [Euzebya sp.]